MKYLVPILAFLCSCSALAECDRIPANVSEQELFEMEDQGNLTPYRHRILAAIYGQKEGCSDENLQHALAATQSGDSSDFSYLGLRYLSLGRYEKAEKYLKKAAHLQNAEAMAILGMLYLEHLNKKNKALYWFKKSEEQGEISAYFYLGDIYFFGRGKHKDIERGIAYWKKGAEKGDCTSALSMGHLYKTGSYREKDIELANYWYDKAYSLGCPQM